MEDSPVVTKPKNRKREMPGKKEKASGKKLSTQTSVEIDAMKAMKNFMNRKLEQNGDKENKECEDDLFGKLVAVELKKFPENIKYRLKHEINNLIFNYKLSQDASNYPPCNMESPTYPPPPVQATGAGVAAAAPWYTGLKINIFTSQSP